MNNRDVDEVLENRLRIFEDIESLIYDCDRRQEDVDTMELSRYAASFASMFHTGAFSSPLIENALTRISCRHNGEMYQATLDSVLHVMTSAHGFGGHTRVVENWIEFSEGSQAHSLVLTDSDSLITASERLIRGVKAKNGKVFTLSSENLISRALELRRIASRYKLVVLHLHMFDVLSVLAFGTETFRSPVLYLNHADHLFWLGISASDRVIDISRRGNEVSEKKRGIQDRCILPILVPYTHQRKDRSASRARLKLSESQKVILSIGSPFKYRPACEFDFPAMALSLVERNDEYLFIIVGPDGHEPWWKQSIAESHGRIVTAGWVPRERLGDYYASADLYIDGFPIGGGTAFVEAVGAGIPVISVESGLTQFEINEKFKIGINDVVPEAVEILSGKRIGSFEDYSAGIACHREENWRNLCTDLLKRIPSRHRTRGVPILGREFSDIDRRLAAMDINFIRFDPVQAAQHLRIDERSRRNLMSIASKIKPDSATCHSRTRLHATSGRDNRDNRAQSPDASVLGGRDSSISDLNIISFYLPQYHPIPENDRWWGKGFTEWRNVARAQPLFDGHYLPHLPGELGFYDLRLPAVRKAQADLAMAHGITGFCYYHYWFNGRLLLERPLQEVLKSGTPDFPFCVCWANENWTRRWDGCDDQVLIAQKYGEEDDLVHIRYLCDMFRDRRYIRINGKALFLVYRANRLPDPVRTAAIWREEARRAGVGELSSVGWRASPTSTPTPRCSASMPP